MSFSNSSASSQAVPLPLHIEDFRAPVELLHRLNGGRLHHTRSLIHRFCFTTNQNVFINMCSIGTIQSYFILG
jgi:hypothetical protein